MPDTRMKGILDRGALADIYRNSLSRIPTVFGRLVYLARLRSFDTGRYEHAGLAQMYGDSEADKALRKQHLSIFMEWLELSTSRQLPDLREFLESLGTNKKQTLDTWRKLGPYRNLVPISVSSQERDLFITDIQSMLRTLTAEVGLAWSDPVA